MLSSPDPPEMIPGLGYEEPDLSAYAANTKLFVMYKPHGFTLLIVVVMTRGINMVL